MIIALNNKCNFTQEEFDEYQKKLKQLNTRNAQVILLPTSIYLSQFKDDNIALGSQNVSSHQMGPHTGEISASQLKSLNVKYCLVGHSERRKEQKETNQDINKKIKQLLAEKITPILCIGEKRSEKDIAINILMTELCEALIGLSQEEANKIIIAYEPVWSIGTGIIPSAEKITKIVENIKKHYPNNKILYGGSVDNDNIQQLSVKKTVDGYLLGRLSLQLESIQKLINELEN